MKKIACVFFELEKGEKVEDVVAKLEANIKKPIKVVNFEREVKDETWRVKLKKLLNDLGEDFSTMGYGVMFDIIEFVEQNPKYKEHFLVKELYAPVISKTGRNYSQIERNIRAMIERIYNNNSVERVHSVLGISEESYEKMANAKFIALVIDRVL